MTVWKKPETGETFSSVKQFLERAQLPGGFKYDSKESVPGHSYVFKKIRRVTTEGSNEITEGFMVLIVRAQKLGKGAWVTQVSEFRETRDVNENKEPGFIALKISGPWGKQTTLQNAVSEAWDVMEKFSQVK